MDKILLIIFTIFISLSSTLQLFLVKEGIKETDIITNVIYFTIAVLIGLFIYIPFIYYPNILSDLIVTKKTLFYLVGEALFSCISLFLLFYLLTKENVSYVALMVNLSIIVITFFYGIYFRGNVSTFNRKIGISIIILGLIIFNLKQKKKKN